MADFTTASESADNNTSSKGLCATPDCGKAATLSCPTCLKLGLNPTRFCSQSCFTGYWSSHKAIHTEAKLQIKAAQMQAQLDNEFKNFRFTGPLRPAAITPTRSVPSHIPRPDYADDIQGASRSEQSDKRSNTAIKVYTGDALEAIRESCRIGREVLDLAGQAVAVGK